MCVCVHYIIKFITIKLMKYNHEVEINQNFRKPNKHHSELKRNYNFNYTDRNATKWYSYIIHTLAFSYFK